MVHRDCTSSGSHHQIFFFQLFFAFFHPKKPLFSQNGGNSDGNTNRPSFHNNNHNNKTPMNKGFKRFSLCRVSFRVSGLLSRRPLFGGFGRGLTGLAGDFLAWKLKRRSGCIGALWPVPGKREKKIKFIVGSGSGAGAGARFIACIPGATTSALP